MTAAPDPEAAADLRKRFEEALDELADDDQRLGKRLKELMAGADPDVTGNPWPIFMEVLRRCRPEAARHVRQLFFVQGKEELTVTIELVASVISAVGAGASGWAAVHSYLLDRKRTRAAPSDGESEPAAKKEIIIPPGVRDDRSR